MTHTPFAVRVAEALERQGLTLRGLCRAARLDPSFFSKVLSGKRSPPMEEAVLRRIAAILDLDAAQLIVAAGRIPEEWRELRNNTDLFRRMDALATQKGSAVRGEGSESSVLTPYPLPAVVRKPDLAEELL